MPLRILVVDDEPLARRKLCAFVAEIAWAEVVGSAPDGLQALADIERLEPDIVFLDIQMPGANGLEVVARLRQQASPPAVVFTTAFDEYAVAAFELDAVDYLLKPFSLSRFSLAIERARNNVEYQRSAAVLERAQSRLADHDLKPRAYNERIFVRHGNNVVPVPLTDITHIEGQDDYVLLHAQDRHYLASLRIRDLESQLPHPPFIRVHRSHIVNLDYVTQLIRLPDSRFEVLMQNGDRVPVSRARSQEIRRVTC